MTQNENCWIKEDKQLIKCIFDMERVSQSGNIIEARWNNRETKNNERKELGITHCNFWNRL